MSTNYYVRTSNTKAGDEGIHLGKTAAGWPFLFRAYPDDNDRPAEVTWDVTDYVTWAGLLDLGQIVSEAGTLVDKDDLVALMDEYRHLNGRRGHRPQGRQFVDKTGNLFTPVEFC